MLNGKSVLVTGGTGSFGKAFIRDTLSRFPKIKRLVVFSRDELKQFEMSEEISASDYPSIRYFLGDIRDKARLRRAFEGVDIIIHAAALKQVPAAEYNPFEFIKTNIIGAQNLIKACLETEVKKVVALSTDKAASPINFYGATKLCSDKLFIAANNIKGKKNINFSIVRYGNVAGSRGSIIPLFKEISHKNVFPITDKEMTRFWITVEQAIDMVEWSFKNNQGGEIVIPKIKSFKVTDLAKAINPKSKIKIIGIRQGEKIHEDLITPSDSLSTYESKNYYIIYPHKSNLKFGSNKLKKVSKHFSYNSGNNRFMTVSEIKKKVLEMKL